jgi:hypothetical protein
MNPGELPAIEAERQALLGQITAAEAALQGALQTCGFDSTARAHLKRAQAHVAEAIIAINKSKSIRTVPQLVADLNRLERMSADLQGRKPQRI